MYGTTQGGAQSGGAGIDDCTLYGTTRGYDEIEDLQGGDKVVVKELASPRILILVIALTI